MILAAQNRLNFSSIYQTARGYTFNGYHRAITWITTQSRWAYSKVPVITGIITRHTLNTLRVGKSFVGNHQRLFIGAATLGVVFWVFHRIMKNRPHAPIVDFKSSLDIARMKIRIPDHLRSPPRITLVFCVDLSGSMGKEGRDQAVESSLKTLLEDAQNQANAGANISISIVGFNVEAHLITDVTLITPCDKPEQAPSVVPKIIENIREGLAKIKEDKKTKIQKGLEGADRQLNRMVEKNKGATHTMILLTDGKESSKSLDQGFVDSFHNSLMKASAQLFAVGIGQSHNKNTLEQIAPADKIGLSATYIDTTQPGHTIKEAIAEIYHKALASFSELKLTSEQLPRHAWSVIGRQPECRQHGPVTYDLGSLIGRDELVETIRIHSQGLEAPLDLSTVNFKVTFKDPQGRQGELLLPWNPTTLIDPAILQYAGGYGV